MAIPRTGGHQSQGLMLKSLRARHYPSRPLRRPFVGTAVRGLRFQLWSSIIVLGSATVSRIERNALHSKFVSRVKTKLRSHRSRNRRDLTPIVQHRFWHHDVRTPVPTSALVQQQGSIAHQASSELFTTGVSSKICADNYTKGQCPKKVSFVIVR